MAVKTADSSRLDAASQLCILKGRGGRVHIWEFPTDFPNYPWRATQLLSLSKNASSLWYVSSPNLTLFQIMRI